MKKNDDESLALGKAFRALADGARPEPDCPDPERLWDAVAGELPTEQVREVVDHISTCPSCAEAWRLAHRLGQGVEEEPSPVLRPTFGAPRERTWRWAAAAAAVVAVGLMIAHLWRTDPGGEPLAGYRAPGSESIRSLLVDDHALPRGHFLLRWSSGSEEVGLYHLRVATEDLQVIARVRGLRESEYLVPERILEQIPAGKRILWQVEAVLQDDSSRISPTFVNRLE